MGKNAYDFRQTWKGHPIIPSRAGKAGGYLSRAPSVYNFQLTHRSFCLHLELGTLLGGKNAYDFRQIQSFAGEMSHISDTSDDKKEVTEKGEFGHRPDWLHGCVALKPFEKPQFDVFTCKEPAL